MPISPIRFVAVTFDAVVRWLRRHGHTVEPGCRAGLWKVDCWDAQTPQMVVKLANNRRCRDHGLPPFQVNTAGIPTAEGSDVLGRSLTGSSMTMQLAGLMAK